MLLRLATEAQRDPEARQRLLDGGRLPPRFQPAIDRYLDLYGFRCPNELKLEEPSLHDRPDALFDILRNYVHLDPRALDVQRIRERERRIRRDAERRAFVKLKPWQRVIFRRVLRNARLGVKNRENLRFARTRIYGLLRELLRALGSGLPLDKPDDIFYLTLDEVWNGRLSAARARRRVFDAYRQQDPPPERFEIVDRKIVSLETPSGDGLEGIGCSPGRVTATVEIVSDPTAKHDLEGKILVAERTDPGWVPLYPAVAGILIERGSILSHSAIVAREMGVPTIVGIRGLLKTLSTGQRVTMDGSAGTVQPVDSSRTKSQ